ncbi:MAG: hypothetical protein KZQ83_15925 [gamma proteobacterium symbiont of Taylorina sp.]|nr:hypothetical protein [gamma proteobacterium symbiont of Taylorina sp.]
MLEPQLEKILYFPSNEITFQPNPDDSPITYKQAERIKEVASNVAGYLGVYHELIQKHIYNKLRVVFCVLRIEDIPQQYYEAALELIDQIKHELCHFNSFLRAINESFAKKILRGDDPWAPSTKTQWCKKFSKDFPDRPDWRKLAKEIQTLKEVKRTPKYRRFNHGYLN